MMYRFRLEDSLDQESKRKAEGHAIFEYPKEACGLLVDGKYWPCQNVADEPELTFILNATDYMEAMLSGTIEAVVHSHPLGGQASEPDRKSCSQTKLVWHIYSVPDGEWSTIDP